MPASSAEGQVWTNLGPNCLTVPLSVTAEQGSDAFVQRACLLAACGWDACHLRSMVAGNSGEQLAGEGLPGGACEMHEGVLACAMCGSRVGLWNFAQQPGQTLPQMLHLLSNQHTTC